MSSYESIQRRPFTRNADRAVVAGVCAGLADHFGFNLCVTRLLAVIALFVACPLTLIIYFATVWLVPAGHDPERQRRRRRTSSSEPQYSPKPTLSDVRKRYQSLDSRLARLERYVTSRRFDLDEEFRKL